MSVKSTFKFNIDRAGACQYENESHFHWYPCSSSDPLITLHNIHYRKFGDIWGSESWRAPVLLAPES
jgi:hypothetical protein